MYSVVNQSKTFLTAGNCYNTVCSQPTGGIVPASRWNSFIQFLSEVYQTPADGRQELVDELLETQTWPWIERDRATFTYDSLSAKNVALSVDIIQRDPPFESMERLDETSLWYRQRFFERDALLDYMFAIDDPGTPLAHEVDLMGRVARYWRPDERNQLRIQTSQVNASVLKMPRARPFPDWSAMAAVPRGKVERHHFTSMQLGFAARGLWVYTPPGYDADESRRYRLLVLMDGQWAANALQVPYIADALIKHGRMEPVIIAMLASGDQSQRLDEYIGKDTHYAMLVSELLPYLQAQHRIEPLELGLGGLGEGAVAAAYAALKNPNIFSRVIMLSPPLGVESTQPLLQEFARRFRDAPLIPKRIFHSVGRYEHEMRYYQPAVSLRGILERRLAQDPALSYRFVELGSGHSLAAFKSVLPEALAHCFPPRLA